RILGVDQGCLVSVNGGKTWSSWFNQPTGQFYHVITDNRFPYWVYGAQQDSGAAGVPSRTNTIDGISITQFREITAGGESDNVAPDPNDPEILYGGRVEKLDTRTYQTQVVDPTIAYPNVDRRTWTLPLVFSHRDSHVLYFANQRVFRTDDGGNHWTVISPDLTRENPGIPANLDATTAELKAGPGSRFGVVYAIAPSRVADHDIWAGTDDGQIWRTHDEGAHWDNVTPPALTGWSKVGIIDTSHFDSETAYAAVDRHRIEDVRPYIYRTHDGGKHWDLVVNGIPNGSFVNAVREDSVRKGLLYAGTEKGVYVSFDDGDHWQPMQLNLPVTSVRDIDVHGNDLVIATHGRAFWVMDDVSPLRVAPAILPAGSPFLFPPAVTVRERGAGFTGSPMPKDEALAANPPSGAYIDYLLGADAKQPVTLEILDAKNNVVRTYSSADKVPAPDLSKLNTAPEWFNVPSHVSATAGMHRFVWSLHYASATGRGRRGGGAGDGVWAPPGNYSVVLTVDGQKLTRPLTVVPDPRIKLPQSAYEEQFALAREIEAEHALVSAAVEEAGKMAKTSKDPHLHEIADITPEGVWWLAPSSTTSLRYIDSALGALENVVNSADVAPTADARASWAKLKPAADAVLAKWNSYKATHPAT
ncbi:MAG TPA: hypothetical protein VH087_17960, partial [Thermoanaerobaculia bacterium]|nr:hypothetical protein [Thermoanaerobaculia bacterium]